MSNRERAADVITTWQARHKNEMDNNTDWAAQNLAGDLADAGLLAPALPEPARRSIEGYHTAHPWAEWDAGNNRVIALKEGEPEVVIQDVGDPELCITMPPDEAREAAYALLAAADEVEGE